MADRHNLCPNPACGVDVTGWGGGETPTRSDVSAQGFPRGWAARYTTSTHMLGPAGPVTAGLAYTVSTYVRSDSFAISGTLAIQWLDAGANEISLTTVAFPAVAGATVTRVSIAGTAPTGAASLRLLHFGENYALNACAFTAVLYELGELADYFDGDTEGASWDGTPGSSTSTLSDGAAAPTSLPPRTHARRALLVR